MSGFSPPKDSPSALFRCTLQAWFLSSSSCPRGETPLFTGTVSSVWLQLCSHGDITCHKAIAWWVLWNAWHVAIAINLEVRICCSIAVLNLALKYWFAFIACIFLNLLWSVRNELPRSMTDLFFKEAKDWKDTSGTQPPPAIVCSHGTQMCMFMLCISYHCLHRPFSYTLPDMTYQIACVPR